MKWVEKAGGCGSRRTARSRRRNGAGDEDTGSDSESDGGQADVDAGGRDHRDYRPDDAPLARAVPGAWLQRSVGLPEALTEPETGSGGGSGKGAAFVPRQVLRLQR